VIEDILPSLEKVRKTGPNNWLACCPAHEDRSPSMTLHAANDGRILVKCFAGCSFDEIVGALGLGWEPWFPPKTELDRVQAIRRPFPAGDVLEALAFESKVVALVASDMRQLKHIAQPDMDRLLIAMERIEEGRRLALG
jgi:hypothetical protein